MADTILGRVTDHWREVKLADLCGIVPGPSGPEFSQVSAGGIGPRILRPLNIHSGLIMSESASRLKKEPKRDVRRFQLMTGDILLTRVAQVGRVAMVTGGHVGWLFNTGLIRLRCNNQVDPRYLRHYLMLPRIQTWMQQNVSGTAITGITKQALSALPVALPPREVQSAIATPLEVLTEKIAVHQDIVTTAARLRDAVAERLFVRDGLEQ